jgi:mono/diheme cytochrome c family protein
MRALAALVVLALVAGWFVLRPKPVDPARFAAISGDIDRGAVQFALAGCASCHADPALSRDDTLVLAGGRAFESAFGTFVAPNISSSVAQGLGAWSDLQIASAIMAGVSADGRHLYPAHPYTSFAKAAPHDVADLIAYLRSLPASDRPSQAHDLGFPYNIRAGLGVWKWLYLDYDWVMPAATDQIAQGRQLVEALGHCAQCHTPRTALGGLDRNRWMAGAPNPSGQGRIPALRPVMFDWSADEIAEYLKTGFTPDFDSAGGSMAAVVRNTAQLSDDQRMAIALYLKSLP